MEWDVFPAQEMTLKSHPGCVIRLKIKQSFEDPRTLAFFSFKQEVYYVSFHVPKILKKNTRRHWHRPIRRIKSSHPFCISPILAYFYLYADCMQMGAPAMRDAFVQCMTHSGRRRLLWRDARCMLGGAIGAAGADAPYKYSFPAIRDAHAAASFSNCRCAAAGLA